MKQNINWGIDLGTTNSSIALFEGSNVKVIKNNSNSEITPSAVFKGKVGNELVKHVGNSAKQKLKEASQHVALEFKQKMGLRKWFFEFPSTGEKAMAADLSAEILRELVKNVKQKEGVDMFAALITVPALYPPPMYEDTKAAGEQAGLKYVEVLEEPIAAALAYGLNSNDSAKKRWLAYDLGGGTFDTALIELEDGILSVIDHSGNNNLGGKNLDEGIVEKYFIPNLPSGIKDEIVPWKSSSWWTLKFMAEEAKCALSLEEEYLVECTVCNREFVYTLTREKLNILENELFLAPTTNICKELLSKRKLLSKDIEKIILIGGSTLSPNLRKMVEKNLEIPIDFSVDPLTAVAQGAAIHAAGREIPAEFVPIPTFIAGNIDVDLQCPSTVGYEEEDIMVLGKLNSTDNKTDISSDWSIEINRVDKKEKVIWTSGKVSVSENGGFSCHVSLEKGSNLFRLIIMDNQGKIVDSNIKEFKIARTIQSIDAKLPYGVGIVDNQGEMVWFFKKDKILPAENKIHLETTEKLKKGQRSNTIDIPIMLGEEVKPYLNQLIQTLKITADDVPTTIPQGSDVELTIKIDASRTIKTYAYLPDYDIDVEATVNSSLDVDLKELHKNFKRAQENFSSLEDIAFRDSVIKQVVENIGNSKLIDTIEILISQARDGNPESATKAQTKLLELRKQIDPVREKGDLLIKWTPVIKDCEHNIELVKNLIKFTEEKGAKKVSSKLWKQFNQQLKNYEDAIRDEDFTKARHIGCGDLLNLILESNYSIKFEGESVRVSDLINVGGAVSELGKGLETDIIRGGTRRKSAGMV